MAANADGKPMTRRRFRWYAIAVGCLVIGAASKLYYDQSRPWTASVVSTTEIADGVMLRRLAFVSGRSRFIAYAMTARKDAICGRVVEVRSEDSPQLVKALGSDGLLAINGGYFDNAFKPLGLLKIDDNEITGREDRSPFSACFIFDQRGRLDLVSAKDERIASAASARQCGPFIIDPGGGIGVKPGGEAAVRTVIATNDQELVVLLANGVRLFDLATCLHEFPSTFGVAHVDRAACLDGGPSSGFVSRDKPAFEPFGRITDALVFSPRAQSTHSTTQP